MRVASLALFCFFVCFAVSQRVKDEDYAFTPHHRVHKNCVHGVPDGTKIRREHDGSFSLFYRDGRLSTMPRCEHEPMAMHGRAWKAWTQYHNLDGFTFMSATWPTPPAPSKPTSSEILYYWPGTEPDDNSFVLQPVLQYGSTPAGGGMYWAVASWYVGDRAFYSNLVNATTGDMMFGTMTAQSNSSWAIMSENSATKQSVSLEVDNIVTQTYAYCVLEAYNLFNCANEYPAGTTSEPFTNLVTDVNGVSSTPQWESMTKDPRICNEHTTITNPTEVAIVWSE
mmetsp:Transcript_3149/g.3873  ORF Transcript_3149/g.3873 Transcript_3149/m.3873 type:complete len:282 (-) Transcript_3149:50-895(-)